MKVKEKLMETEALLLDRENIESSLIWNSRVLLVFIKLACGKLSRLHEENLIASTSNFSERGENHFYHESMSSICYDISCAFIKISCFCQIRCEEISDEKDEENSEKYSLTLLWPYELGEVSLDGNLFGIVVFEWPGYVISARLGLPVALFLLFSQCFTAVAHTLGREAHWPTWPCFSSGLRSRCLWPGGKWWCRSAPTGWRWTGLGPVAARAKILEQLLPPSWWAGSTIYSLSLSL